MQVKFLPKSELMNPFDPNLELPQKSAINNVNKDRDETMLELSIKQGKYIFQIILNNQHMQILK